MEKKEKKKKSNLNSKYLSILSKEQSHMTSEIKRRRKPTTWRDIKLCTASLSQLRNGRNRSLKGLRVHSDPITHSSKIREVKRHGSQPRQWLPSANPTTEHEKPINDVPLPNENRSERDDPQHHEQCSVRCEQRYQCPLVL